VAETQAGKGSLPYDHPGALGAIGVTGTLAANRIAATADLVIGIGTRYSDFTTASKTAFAGEGIRFVNVNVASFDALKMGGLALAGDARATVEALDERLRGWTVDAAYRDECEKLRADWDREVSRLYQLGHGPLPAQSEVIGAVNELSGARDVVVCAAGSMPGDLHKLWRTRDPKGYHVEYGYSTMGYEIAGGLGVKMADPTREVYVMVGDGSYLMMSQEIVTSIQEHKKLNIVLVDNQGFASIGGLSRDKGTAGFGTRYRYRSDASLGDDAAHKDGEALPVDLALSAEGLGAHVFRAKSIEDLRDALVAARKIDRTVVIHIPTDRYEGVPSYESWWEVPVAEVSKSPEVETARREHERESAKRKWHL
jgi:3D-(3,5/4)-trihydroxycyclohexane-1,2-dione acylhydrolase (decyclizing)